MAKDQQISGNLLSEWENTRFFARLFSEGMHMRASAIRFAERESESVVEIVVAGDVVKSMRLAKPTLSALVNWLLGRCEMLSGRKLTFGAPSGFYSASVDQGGAAGLLLSLSELAYGDLFEEAQRMGLKFEGVFKLEAILERTPGVIAVLCSDKARADQLVRKIGYLFGWVNAGVVDLESAANIELASRQIPVIVGVQADSIPEALSRMVELGLHVTKLPMRGYLIDDGSVLTWFMPLSPSLATVRSKPLETKRRPKGATQKPKAHQRTLLVVEDDPDQQQILQMMLQAEGFEVSVASNGVDALEYLREHHVDGVITDLMMPILDGKQLLQSIRRDPKFKDIPVLVLTVLDDEAKESELLKLGANDYCIKTAQPKLFIERIKKVMGPSVSSPTTSH